MLSKEQALVHLADDIRLRGLSQGALDSYVCHVRIFLNHSNKPVDKLDAKDIRDFILHLQNHKKYAVKTVNSYSAAIRFFFAVTLDKPLNYLQTPRMKDAKRLPDFLSREEIAAILRTTLNIKHKALFLLAYGSGLRVSEIARLKTGDIDSKAMRVFVAGGKGRKDRYTLLPKTTLHTLREYWRLYRPTSTEGWLFPGMKKGHITRRAINFALTDAGERAGIERIISPHLLRHSFATHLLEDGLGLMQIKELMGHASIKSTTIYLHAANWTADVISPADRLAGHG